MDITHFAARRARTAAQYDSSRKQRKQEATWSTRTWLALQAQRMSIAVHFATAYQIARELDLAGPEDAAAFLGGGDADA